MVFYCSRWLERLSIKFRAVDRLRAFALCVTSTSKGKSLGSTRNQDDEVAIHAEWAGGKETSPPLASFGVHEH